MCWPFRATVCMWAILSQSCFCCLMICRFQWERMLLQTAEVALIQMSHLQVLAPKGQHIQKAKYEHLNVLKIPLKNSNSISITDHSVTVSDNMKSCVFWNVQHTNETLWRWKKFPLSLASQTSRNCVWGNWFEEHIRGFNSAECYENLIMDIF